MTSNPTDQDALARKILLFSRQCLSRLVPALLPALYALKDRSRDTPGPLSTDGRFLGYQPQQVIQDFRANRNRPALQLLHVTLHCLLGHLPARREVAAPALLDAAADIRVNTLARALAGPSFALDERRDSFDDLLSWFQIGQVADRCNQPGTLTALCTSLQDDRLARNALLDCASLHAVDDHTLWNPSGPAFQSGDGMTAPQGMTEQGAPDWNCLLCQFGKGLPNQNWGGLPAFLTESIRPTPENQISYRHFLRRFATPRENMHADPDSIDAKWYHLGLSLYGDLPILEPCEVCDQPIPDQLVIALDTSGSCEGEICARFLRETLNLLRDITGGRPSFRILLLQCDCQIQKELLLEHSSQLDTFLSDFTPQGFGGTDFCPVFQRVEELRQSGRFHRVRGLLYLSDGFGDFPEIQPDYPVTFLLPRDQNQTITLEPSLPKWVTPLWLDLKQNTVQEVRS